MTTTITKMQEGKVLCLERLADALTSAKRFSEAEPLYKEFLELNRALGGSVDRNVRIMRSYTSVLKTLHLIPRLSKFAL